MNLFILRGFKGSKYFITFKGNIIYLLIIFNLKNKNNTFKLF